MIDYSGHSLEITRGQCWREGKNKMDVMNVYSTVSGFLRQQYAYTRLTMAQDFLSSPTYKE